MKITIEYDLADCFTDKGDLRMQDWLADDIREDALFDKWGIVRDETFEALNDLIIQKNWSWHCDACALYHLASFPQLNHYRLFKERK